MFLENTITSITIIFGILLGRLLGVYFACVFASQSRKHARVIFGKNRLLDRKPLKSDLGRPKRSPERFQQKESNLTRPKEKGGVASDLS